MPISKMDYYVDACKNTNYRCVQARFFDRNFEDADEEHISKEHPAPQKPVFDSAPPIDSELSFNHVR